MHQDSDVQDSGMAQQVMQGQYDQYGDDPYNADQYSQDQYNADQQIQDQYNQDEYNEEQYNQDQYNEEQSDNRAQYSHYDDEPQYDVPQPRSPEVLQEQYQPQDPEEKTKLRSPFLETNNNKEPEKKPAQVQALKHVWPRTDLKASKTDDKPPPLPIKKGNTKRRVEMFEAK